MSEYGDQLTVFLCNDEVGLLQADFKPRKYWSSEERREYMARALRKHRKKLREEEEEQKNLHLSISQDIEDLKLQEAVLINSEEKTREFMDSYAKHWDEFFLLKQNEMLRKRVERARIEKYTLLSVAKLQLMFPRYNAVDFFQVISQSVSDAVNLFSNVVVTKHGKILLRTRKVKCAKNRTRYRRKINQEIESHKNKILKFKVKTLCVDESLKMNSFFDDIDLLELSNIFWYLFKYDAYENNFSKYFDTERNFVNLTSDQIPIRLSSNSKGDDYKYQAIHVSKQKLIGTNLERLVINVLVRNDDFASITTTAVQYDPVGNCFFQEHENVTNLSFQKSREHENRIMCTINTTSNALNRIAETVNIAKAAWTFHKRGDFKE
eukprot:snap_masked-scaffold_2-processed-gene-6.1-mRNA-1 protein AED:1.00 eAED:1.00 QI:0/0/0/0/1/1/2/0/378